MNKVLVIDDDGYIRELICTVLKNEGFSVTEAVNGRDALQKLGEEKIDLCVLDIMMPQMDGYEFCKQVRRYYEDMPVLMLTAKSELSQKVRGFEIGADDYLTKPFEVDELIVRIKALLRRYKVAASQTINIGDLVMDKSSYAIIINHEKCDIPMKEFELLFLLGSYPGKTLSRDKLIEDIWGLDFDGNERTLDVHINRLRERFPSDVYKFRITTIRGLGYRLEAAK
ncbi:response regulator with CheY-like receiver domain and winged-helix DNA-binding domain [Desulfosporosinus acidiphilus SJ4]|uniref:Heme response regulator HssR n=1 Tax=Desulfosporosinus acidiphilus (strain DSM 22704 / JCM 16185 / SJ4) TaxID=646529 RepID=I4D6S9_DESAJ|nr:response regulator transcription factor [Desulfosporosinus acidiphilus]AFM41503.1 response regulator with CheY-like receiver domain and winged-helix DNA-binding domain [Desulfosporosinus acidiphilus SJ4]